MPNRHLSERTYGGNFLSFCIHRDAVRQLLGILYEYMCSLIKSYFQRITQCNSLPQIVYYIQFNIFMYWNQVLL